jgi:3-oxoacyl-(acyl-carrier-protein) synthase
MRGALADAGMRPDEVGLRQRARHLDALNDSNEAVAIAKVFGDATSKLSVSSTKSMTDTCSALPARGVHRLAVVDPRSGRAPHDQPLHAGPACGDLDVTPNKARPREVRAAMSNSAGFGRPQRLTRRQAIRGIAVPNAVEFDRSRITDRRCRPSPRRSPRVSDSRRRTA